jgi:TolA-binding protein
VIWHQIGKPEMAGKFLSLAARNRLSFYPSTPDTYCLPASLSRAYQNIAKALNAGKPIPEITQIATLAEIMNDAGVTTTAISARTCLYRDAADLFSTLVKSKEIPGDWTEGEYDRAVFQVFLEELAEVCKHASRPEVFLSYAAALLDYPQHQSSNLTVRQGLLGHLAPEDRLDGSKWFVEQAKPFIKDKPGFAEVFHSFFSDLFERENDVTNEAFHLGELAKMNRQTDAAHAQFQRLSDLYLDQWKLPAQAIQVQRRIIEVFPNCDKEWQARLKIAKIQYSETAFQEAIYELTLLLAKLPQDYQDAPARTMLGLAYVAAAAYEDARDQFAQVINKDTGEYREQCLYLTGYSYICEQKYSEVVKPFKDLVNLYPNGPHTTTAKDFLGKIEGTGAKK